MFQQSVICYCFFKWTLKRAGVLIVAPVVFHGQNPSTELPQREAAEGCADGGLMGQSEEILAVVIVDCF